ncbi:hypothetical protein JCGZ_15370 [Jatropha curcas]|uniref:Uncharacterized protein n=1 Tax=Jatropha curcas TaxID=180498 RepID=A0A067K934_JATCU|nr:hypothetical protein JCGZ_15370 [Jatropha curcas]
MSNGGGAVVEGGGPGGGAVEDRAIGRFLAATDEAGLLRLYRGGMVNETGVQIWCVCV